MKNTKNTGPHDISDIMESAPYIKCYHKRLPPHSVVGNQERNHRKGGL